MTSRRDFLKMGAVGIGALAIPWRFDPRIAQASQQVPQIPIPGSSIPKWVDPMPHFAGQRVPAGAALAVSMENHLQQVLSTGTVLATGAVGVTPGVGLTRVWAYKVGGKGPLYPGFSVEATRGIPTQVTYTNNLNDSSLYQLLTVDQSLHWANPLGSPMMVANPVPPPAMMGNPAFFTGPVAVAPHLHGGEVPPWADGGPDAWWTPGFTYTGHAFTSNTYYYPNSQEAGTLWFHDHALGITRLNVYAGMAAFYLLRDPATMDTGVPSVGGLPAGNYEIEIAIQDRMFDMNGQWYFPDAVPLVPNPLEHPYWVPEFVGDTIVVNGKTWPFLNVEPRRYRFRVLNGSNARTYDLSIPGGPPIWQIGTDGGLLDLPVKIDGRRSLLLMPGERADLIIDFAGSQGKTLTVQNSGRTPFPKGTPPQGSTLGQILQFRVARVAGIVDSTYNPALGGQLRTPMIRLANSAAGALAAGVVPQKTRLMTLNEVMGMGGPLEVLVNNTRYMGVNPDGTTRPDFTAKPNSTYYSEIPSEGETEVWEIVNMTADAHPIHLHLIQFQLINRQDYNANKYIKAYAAAFPGGGLDPMTGLPYPIGVYMPSYGPPQNYDPLLNPLSGGKLGGNPDITPHLQGSIQPPNPNEAGWKDTVIMYPGQVTRIAVRFAPTDKPTAMTPAQLWFPFNPNGGHGYVWHCHIIDHEDNEMMRPYDVTPNPNAPIGRP